MNKLTKKGRQKEQEIQRPRDERSLVIWERCRGFTLPGVLSVKGRAEVQGRWAVLPMEAGVLC